MKIDEMIALAREVEDGGYYNAAEVEREGRRLARAVLALLTPEKPCGWDESDVAYAGLDGVHVYSSIHTNADELHWAALVLLRAAESLRAKENKSHG